VLRLYRSPASPYVRKVMVVLHETGQDGDIDYAAAQGTPLDSAAMPVAHNPVGKIPVLERSDGPALYDSRVICRYLDARAEAGLYPEPPRLWDSLVLEATADGILDAAVAMVYESRLRPEALRSADVVEAQWAKIARSLDAVEERWMSHLYGRLDIGQIAVGCALGYLDFRHGDRAWRQGRDALAAWEKRFAGRASMMATVPSAA
jgi:glutathione S-transferase